MFFKDSWLFWLVASAVSLLINNLINKNKKIEANADAATTSDQFSMSTTFLSFRRGEAALFFLMLIAIMAFFFASIGFVKHIGDVINF